MTIAEKITLSENTETLVLFKEGIFYKLYNHNAMLFTVNIKPYTVKVKFIKNIGQDVYSIGFPISYFENANTKAGLSIKQQLENIGGQIMKNDDWLELINIKWVNKPAYEKWCLQQKKKKLNNDYIANKATNDFETLKQRILDFQVINKTPMQAFEFIMELQGKLK